jgi:hypothetical protein
LSWLQGESFTQRKVRQESQIKYLFRKQGISSKGVQIILKGPATQNNIIKPINIKLYIFKNYHEEYNEVSGDLWNTVSHKDEKLIVVNFPDFIIPEGCILPYLDEAKSRKEMEEILKKQYEIGFGVKIELIGLTKSNSEFYVFALPLSNPLEGQANCSIIVDISE